MKKLSVILSVLPVIVIVFAGAACQNNPPSTTTYSNADFDRNYALWAGKHITDYSFDIRIKVFVPGSGNPIHIEVQNGVAAEYNQTSEIPAPLPDWIISGYDTIEKLFTRIENAYEEQAHSVTVGYDPVYGFPNEASVDPVEMMVDEEWGFTVTNFAPENSKS